MKVIIEAINAPVVWQEPGETATLRIEALKGFTTSDGQFIPSANGDGLYLEIPITITGGVPLIPSFEIDSTEDAYPWDNETTGDVPGYKATIITSRKKKIPYFPAFKVPVLQSGDTSFTWAELRVFNRSFRRRYTGLDRLISVTQAQEWIQNAVGTLNKSSETNLGVLALDTDPLDPAFPRAISTTSPKLNFRNEQILTGNVPAGGLVDIVVTWAGGPFETSEYVISAIMLEPNALLQVVALKEQSESGCVVTIKNLDTGNAVSGILKIWAMPVLLPVGIPEAPTTLDLAASTDGSGTVNVTISSVIGAGSYDLWRKTGIGGIYTLIASGLTAFPYHDTTTAYDTTYYYKARASNVAGTSDFSPEFNVTTETLPPPVVPPDPDIQWKVDGQAYVNGDLVGTLVATFGPNATQATAANKPVFRTNQLGAFPAIEFDGVNDTLVFPEETNIRVVIAVVQHDLTGLNVAEPIVLGHSTGRDFIGWAGTQLLDRTGNGDSKVRNGAVWVNGVSINPFNAPKACSTFEVLAFRTSSAAAADNIASDRGAGYFKGKLIELQIFTSDLTDAQIITGSQTLMAAYGLGVLPLVQLNGDSITSSAPQLSGIGWWNGAIQGRDTWGALLVPLLLNSDFGAFDLINLAKGGWKTTDVIANIAEAEAVLAQTRSKRCSCVQISTNDILSTGDSAADIYARMLTICSALKAAGADKVGLATVIANNAGSDARRLALNALINGGNAAYDFVCDLAADSRLSNSGNLLYYQPDGIHLNVGGQGVEASLWAAAIWAAYGITPPSPPAPNATLWLKADSITGHVDNDILADGFVWANDGTGGDAVVHAGDNPVRYKTNVLNGLPAVRLNVPFNPGNSASWLDIPSLTLRTIFIVCKFSPGTFPDYTGFISGQDTSGVNGGYVLLGVPISQKVAWGTNAFLAAYKNGANKSFVSGGHDFSLTDTYWIGSFVTPAEQSEALRIGYALAANRQFEGDILEIKGFDTVLTNDQRHVVEAELGTKYGISMSVE